MPRRTWIKVLFAGTVVLFLTSAQHPVAAQSPTEPLYLANATIPPVTTEAGDGYRDRILDEMFARAGLHYKIADLPPARALMSANAGDVDGETARFKGLSSEFDHLVMVPEPIFHIIFAGLFVRSEIDIQTWDDLAEYRIGHIRGWRIFELMFEDHVDRRAVANAETLLNMLQHDRIDVALLTISPARRMAIEMGMPRPFATKARIHKDLFMYLNEKHADKVDILNDALLSMKADGTYDSITVGYVAEEE